MDPITDMPPERFMIGFGDLRRADCSSIEEVFDRQLMNKANIFESDPEPLLEPLPQFYTGMKDWPSSTNIRCWRCARQFTGIPRFVPSHIDADTHRMGVRGVMCSFSCAAAYIGIAYIKQEAWDAHQRLLELYFKLTGKIIAYIPPSEEPTCMKMFGGSFTASQYEDRLL
jgi:hypothetical protein